jgi:hypothetical protein
MVRLRVALRYWPIYACVLGCLACLPIYVWYRYHSEPEPPVKSETDLRVKSQIESGVEPEVGPIVKVECHHSAGTTTGDYAWDLKIDARGHGELAIYEHIRLPARLPVTMPVAELQKLIQECNLGRLPSQIGLPTADAPKNRMRIRTANLDKTITIDFLEPKKETAETRCALRLWGLINEWVQRARKSKPPNSGEEQ